MQPFERIEIGPQSPKSRSCKACFRLCAKLISADYVTQMVIILALLEQIQIVV